VLDRLAALLDRLANPPLPVGRAAMCGLTIGWPASAPFGEMATPAERFSGPLRRTTDALPRDPNRANADGEDLNPLSTPPRLFRSTASPAGSIA